MNNHPLLSCTAALALAAILAPAAARALTVTKVSEVTRPSSSTYGAEQISGITWAGGNRYYAVDDNDKKLYPLTLEIGADGSLAASDVAIGPGVSVSGAVDMEGCAFDPASGKIWVSDEGTYNNRNTLANIREINPETGVVSRKVAIPVPLLDYYSNFSFEALTISGDGLTMWTSNEESLKCDGTNSTLTAGTTVRLTRFIRASVHDNWTADGQWAYLTEPIAENASQYLASSARNGVAALTVLPDGTLLVLERGYRGWGILADDFKNYIYSVNFSGATDISGFASLKDVSYTRVSKSCLWKNLDLKLVNYEGMCLGPRLSDGSCVLVVVADGGSGGSEKIMTLKLSGLNVRTLYVAGADESEPVGGPYRYVDGSTVSVALPGAGSPYETALRVHPAWAAPYNGARGEGSSASFAITADDTLAWFSVTNAGLPLLGADSFERLPDGTETPALPGWSGDGGWIATESYSPALPPGLPLALETHTGVLAIDGDVVRSYANVPGEGAKVDLMLRGARATADAPAEDADGQIALYFAEDGRATLQHRSADGASRLRTPLSPRVFENGDWVRASLVFDYATGPAGAAWCQVRLDGQPCVTDAGVRSPANPVSPGSWYRTLDGGTAGKISELALHGNGAVDDLALYDAAGAFEFAGPTKTNGVPYSWFNEQGLAWDPAGDIDGDARTARAEYAAGTDPWDETDYLRILGTGFDAQGRFTVLFNGAADLSRFAVEETDDLADVAEFGELAWEPASGYGPILPLNGTNVWTQADQAPDAPPSRFFRVTATLPE